MQSNIVKLVFECVTSGNGIASLASQSKEAMGGVANLTKAVTRLGSAFGTAGQSAASIFSGILKGGAFGLAVEGVRMLVGAFQKWRDAAKEAAEAQDRAMKESMERGTAAANELKESYQRMAAAIDEQAKQQKADIELSKQQTKATLELAAAKAKAAGNMLKASQLLRQASAAERQASERSAAVDVAAAQKKVGEAKKAAPTYGEFVDANGNFDAKKWEKARRRRNGRIYKLRAQIAEETALAYQPGGIEAEAMGLTAKGPQHAEELKKELEEAEKARLAFVETVPKMRQAAENLADANRKLDAAKRSAEVTAHKTAAAEVEDRSADAAERRAVAEKEIRDRLAALNAQKSALRGGASPGGGSFRSQFEQAFDLWRDPEAAKAAQEREKQREDDMKRFRKSVDRYGGKWRIDEYAELMRRGDSEGMQEKLAEWRKSSKFTPEVEQMVKAAAAEKNENAAERSLANIEKNTADLAKKLDDLLSVK